MKILISGKNIEVGASLQAHIEKRLAEVVHKHLDRVVNLNVVMTKEGYRYKCDINGNTGTSSGVMIKSTGTSEDVYASFDMAADKIEKQLRRYKRRITNHHKVSEEPAPVVVAKKYVIKDHEEEVHDDAPVVIAEKPTEIETLTVSAAVMKMDLADLPALMFFNSANGRINVVYKRADGNISWVDPEGKAA
ncbi:MAG TPA: ribosome-associated translation inhibitor RaiA [Rickettsiales bacterium]|nr:ribosome-associated translation inhibitor RaiA [Rickettsiales bacterium]